MEWDQLSLWENERVRAEVWLDTSAGGWLWSVTHRDGEMRWVTIDSGQTSAIADAYAQVAQVMDYLAEPF